MVQLRILSGKQAGAVVVARRFPFRIGRSEGADWRAEDAGVWEEHAEINLEEDQRFSVRTLSDGLVSLNRQPVSEAVLRNADLIEMGSLRFRFWLGETRQKRLGWREALVWSLIAGMAAAQVALIIWLLRL